MACGPTPDAVCKAQMAAECDRMWTCDGSLKVGTDLNSCNSSSAALCALATAGGSYDLAKAEKCTSELKAQSCEAYKAGKPASCSN